MSGKFFLDTNILRIGSMRIRQAKRPAPANSLREPIETRREIVSHQVVQEFFNVALRRFGKPITQPEARQYLSVTFRPLLSVYPTLGLYGTHSRHQPVWLLLA